MTWPAEMSFDPSDAAGSPALDALLSGTGAGGPVLAIVTGREARRDGWAARAAIALAERAAARGASVILADLSLEEPELHDRLGVENVEGLTDAFLFGASFDHVVCTVPGSWFRLIPAAPFTPDPAEVLRHPRWPAIVEELEKNQSELFAYLPVDVPGAVRFIERADRIIVLADAAEVEAVRSRVPDPTVVVGVLTRSVQTASAETAGAAVSERTDDGEFEKIRIPKDSAREALIADLRARQRAALQAPEPALTPLPPEESLLPPAPTAQTPARRAPAGQVFTLHKAEPTPEPRARPWLMVVLVVLLLGAVGSAAWYIWQTRFSTSASRTATAEPAAPVAPPAAPLAASDSAARITLPYSVAIASYQDLEVALGRLEQLGEQAPDLAFYVAPLQAQQRTFYRILAGPLPDSGSAVLLLDTLLARRIKTISSGWDVQNAPFAFLIGEHAGRAEAEAQQEEAVRKGVPTYIVGSTRADGSEQFLVYAGAYTGPGDAEFMRPILRSAGFPDNLVERSGSIRS